MSKIGPVIYMILKSIFGDVVLKILLWIVIVFVGIAALVGLIILIGHIYEKKNQKKI